jgi:hypothetical protein
MAADRRVGLVRVKRPGSTDQAVEAALAVEVASSDAHSLSFDPYSASAFQPSADARFVMLVMAFGSLLYLQPRPEFSGTPRGAPDWTDQSGGATRLGSVAGAPRADVARLRAILSTGVLDVDKALYTRRQRQWFEHLVNGRLSVWATA